MRNLLSLFLVLTSLFCFGFAGYLYWLRTIPLTPVQVAETYTDPVSLSLPDLGLSLPVLLEPMTIKGVTYEPHGKNLVLYGHNWPNILGTLKNSQVGQSIELAYAGNQTQKFIITEIKVVKGTAVEILEPTPDSQLTLYTCTGFLDTNRLVVIAKPA